MSERDKNIMDFLNRSGLPHAKRQPLAGDASFRRYERILDGNSSYILMDAPPEKEDVRPFIRVAEFLCERGFSAPKIIEQDNKNRFLLLEDLGDKKYSSLLLNATPEEERRLYEYAVQALAALHEIAPLHTLEPYDTEKLMRECLLLTEWYLPHISGKATSSAVTREYENLWRSLLQNTPLSKSVTVLRDYHADNLLWLEERKGIKKVGMLDFQDAVIGDPAYDLVSLLEDARRDVSPSLAKKMIDYYLEQRNTFHLLSPQAGEEKESSAFAEQFLTAYAVLGAQRNCKILGIFARLARRDGKQHYLAMLPRVMGYLRQDVQHPALTTVKKWLKKNMEEF